MGLGALFSQLCGIYTSVTVTHSSAARARPQHGLHLLYSISPSADPVWGLLRLSILPSLGLRVLSVELGTQGALPCEPPRNL